MSDKKCPHTIKDWRGNGYGWHRDRFNSLTQSAPNLDVPMILKNVDLVGTDNHSDVCPDVESQDFYKLRDECLARGILFEDPIFPPTTIRVKDMNIDEWKRPGEIVKNPKFFECGYSRFDVQQGCLGDCWFLVAMADLTLCRRLFFQVVPEDQGFDKNYAGIFHFRFWYYERWIDVVVDDRLPTYKGKLLFLRSSDTNEFWSSLLEKAYAKLQGSYQALQLGCSVDAMEDFTGGITEVYYLQDSPSDLFDIMWKAYERSSLIGCSTMPTPDVQEAKTPEGLLLGHAYSVTKVQYVDVTTSTKSKRYKLIRLRNPWGDKTEWNGPWSDGSHEWCQISKEQKRELGLIRGNDGEFWMSFYDFRKYFATVEICNLTPDSLSDDCPVEGQKKQWVMCTFDGKWVPKVSAGGPRKCETHYKNPQYRFKLDETDEGTEEDERTMIVALMQKNRRRMTEDGRFNLLFISYTIYQIPEPSQVPRPLDYSFFVNNDSFAAAPMYTNSRGISYRFKLPKGTYCLMPSTHKENEEGDFFIRVISEHPIRMEYDGCCDDINENKDCCILE